MVNSQKPVICQVLPRLFGNLCDHCVPGGSAEENGCGHLRDFTLRRLEAIRALGATHVWYTGVLDHATRTDYSAYGMPADRPCDVKGLAGSPYAIRDYYNIAPDLAVNIPDRLTEFDNLVRRTHRTGLGVIIDFVPNHVARHYTGTIQPFTDDNHYPGRICDGDWTDTTKLNYGSDDTRRKMLDILLFWASHGVDGFRCDMVELTPVDFWAWAIPQVKALHPDMLFIAEVYQPWRYRDYLYQGGFDYLYDKSGLYDTLMGILRGHRPSSDITRCWQELGDITPRMLHFLENHDESRLASDFICGNALAAIPALIVSATIDTCPFMFYFGQQLGERGMEAEGFSGIDGKTTIFDYWSVPTVRRCLQGIDQQAHLGLPLEENGLPAALPTLSETENFLRRFHARLFHLVQSEPAISKGSFFDLMYVNPTSECFDATRQYTFLRHHDHDLLLICVHFGDTACDVRINLPSHAFDYLQLPHLANVRATNLLSEANGDSPTLTLPLDPDCPVPLHLEPHSGVILKITIP